MASVVSDHVTIHLPIFNLHSYSLKKNLLRVSTGGRLQRTTKALIIEALRDVSFEASEGERIGIIGLNGAGKTTLLRAIAGILHPTGGSMRVHGQVVPLLALGLGVYEEATGWENIRHCALQLGMPQDEIDERMEEIGEFTELREHLDLPYFTYSAGMKMRLCFAVATARHAEIMVLDEIISTGDILFAEKCAKRFSEVIERARIVFLATHDLAAVENWCTKALLLDEGRVLDFGPPQAIVSAYRRRAGA